jgi:drug/metabolite transporter (DMT)-like permease
LRTLGRFVPLLIFALYKKINPLKTEKVKENIFRAILASFGTYLFMLAYRYASSMIDVIVVGYSTAIFVIPLSVFIIKEKFYAKNLIAVILGFLGVLISFRPGCGIFQFGTMYAVIGAVVSALNQVFIKKLTVTESELTIIFYHHILLFLISLSLGLSCDSLILSDAAILFIGGMIGAIAQCCIIHALKIDNCSRLASAYYVMLIPATLIDFFMYGKIPDLFILSGLLLIICGSYFAVKKKILS